MSVLVFTSFLIVPIGLAGFYYYDNWLSVTPLVMLNDLAGGSYIRELILSESSWNIINDLSAWYLQQSIAWSCILTLIILYVLIELDVNLPAPKGLVVPKGPNFNRAGKVAGEFGGTKLIFKAPKHSPMRLHEKSRSCAGVYSSVEELSFRKDKAKRGLTNRWCQFEYFYHSWAFNGPWFTGAFSELQCHINIIKAIKYPKDFSLFHPRALESVIDDYLTYGYSHHIFEFAGNIQEFEAPVDWQPLTHLSVNAVRFKVASQGFSTYRTEHWVISPLTDNLMVTMVFRPNRLNNLPREILDERVDEKPMLELIDNIIDSIEVELSPVARAQQKAALEGLDDSSLIKEHPLLKWDKLGSVEKAELLERENAKALKYYRDLLAQYEAEGKQYAR